MRKNVGVAVAGLVLLAAGVAMLVVARASHDDALRLISSAMIVSELGVTCFWWPLIDRAPAPMARWASIAARAFGVTYAGTLAVVGADLVMTHYHANEVVPWFVGVFAVPFIGTVVLLISRPRLLLYWCACGVLVPAAAIVFLIWITPKGGSMGTDAIVPVWTLVLSSFPNGMLIGWFFAWFLGRPRIPRIA